MNEIFAMEYYGNTVEQYAIALSIILGAILIVRIFRKKLLNQLKKWTEKTETKLDDRLPIICRNWTGRNSPSWTRRADSALRASSLK